MFGITDYVVFISTILISFCIGIFFAVWERKRNTTVDYFLAGRKSNMIPVALSQVVSFQSSLVMLGIPAEGYTYGVGIAYYAIGIIIAYMFAAFVIVPVFYPLKLISVYEYFNLRYGNNTLRYMSLALGIVYTLVYMATVTVGTCVALNVVIGIPAWGTILIYTLVTAVYTSIGGIKAVIWTDVFQLIVMTTGITTILIKASMDTGGSDQVFEFAKDRFGATDFRFDPTIRYQFWTMSIGTISSMLYMTLTQPAMQRIYSVPNVREARNLYLVAAPLYALITVMAVVEGMTLFAYFSGKGCDILKAGLVDNVNAIVPFAVLEIFLNQPGLAGLFTASLSSAALSTLSSSLSSLSAVTYEDIIKVNFPHMKSYQATRFAKIIVLLYGVLAMGISFAIIHVPGSISVICASFAGCMDGPICATVLMSLMCRRATTKGVSVGLICGFAIALWLNFGTIFSDVAPYPFLPSGPVDKCYIYDNYTNMSIVDVHTSGFANSTLFLDTETTLSLASTTPDTSGRTSSPLYAIYSISYILYSPIGFLTTICIGLVVSLFTKEQGQVDERCLFSFRKHFLGDLCAYKTAKSVNKKDGDNKNDLKEVTSFLSTNVEF